MYQVVRETFSVAEALSSSLAGARTRVEPPRFGVAVRTADDSGVVVSAPRTRLSRRIVRRVLGPVARPVLWRLRTFFAQPMHDEAAGLNARLGRESALLAAQLQRTESLVVALSESVRALRDEVELLREGRE